MASPLFLAYVLVFTTAAIGCLAGAVVLAKFTNPLHGLYCSTGLVATPA